MLIVEEGAPGGFAAHVLAWMANAGRLDDGVAVRALTLPDRFVDHDSQSGQLALAGLDAAGIERAALRLVQSGKGQQTESALRPA